MALSEDDLRGLSANERAALTESEEHDEDGDIAAELGHTAAPPAAPSPKNLEVVEPDDEEDEGGEGAAAGPAPGPPPAADPAAAPPADPPPAAEEEEEDDAVEFSAPKRAAPDDIDDQRKALNAREDESMQKLLDGEITQEEHATVKNEVRDALNALLVAEATDRASAAVLEQQLMHTYKVELKATLKLGREAGINYKDEKLAAEFDRALKMFANEAVARGLSDSPGNLAASKEALSEAHALMLRRHGKKGAAPAPAPAVPAPSPAAPVPAPRAKERPAPDRSQLGVTLAGVPAAADATITSEFAHLEGIKDPAALERELAKLTPDQQERYLGA